MSKEIIILSNGIAEDEMFVKEALSKKHIPIENIIFTINSSKTYKFCTTVATLMTWVTPYKPQDFININARTVSISKKRTNEISNKYVTTFNTKISELLEDFFKYEEENHDKDDIARKINGLNIQWKNWLKTNNIIYNYKKAEPIFMYRMNFILFLRLATNE